MFLAQLFFSLSLLYLIQSHLQINLHQTHGLDQHNTIQRHCLNVPAHDSGSRHIISYCITQWPLKFPMKKNNRDPKFTFEQLAQQNVTNHQLYLWSAPIDLIEQYQHYLNQLAKSEQTSLGSEIFYNCTLPHFGLQCEYLLEDHQSYHSSLDEIVYDYYRYNRYHPTLLTCYEHLECNRGPSPSCLDWREICDEKVDCLDGGLDEEHCWQLESQGYLLDEDPLANRRCLSEIFLRDDSLVDICLGQSTAFSEDAAYFYEADDLVRDPTFGKEDLSCTKYHIRYGLHFVRHDCLGFRNDLLVRAMFSIQPQWLSNECWSIIKCIFILTEERQTIHSVLCSRTVIETIMNKMCPDLIVIPAVPILYGHVYVAYRKDKLVMSRAPHKIQATYFCYNDQRLYVPKNDEQLLFLNNNTCSHVSLFHSYLPRISTWFRRNIVLLRMWLHRHTISLDNTIPHLDQSKIYTCINQSKTITKIRLLDGIADCPDGDDEQIPKTECSDKQNINLFKCPSTNTCIPTYWVGDGKCDCTQDNTYSCEDEDPDLLYSLTTISFQTICDGYPHLLANTIENSNETDETNCQSWPSVHIYNRCDGFWNTLDGLDELNCDPTPFLNCSINHHLCISSQTNELMCLHIDKANDGIIDCLGAADEPTVCHDGVHQYFSGTFYCQPNKRYPCTESREICDSINDCFNDQDENVCKPQDLVGVTNREGICQQNYESDRSDMAKILCRRFSYTYGKHRVYFTLDQWPDLIKRHSKQENTSSERLTRQMVQLYQPRCHRGLNLQVSIDQERNRTEEVCLCPPSYYGDQCQYQNQRVALTLQFQVPSDSIQTLFAIVVSLIDDSNERIIHSSEQLIYIAIENCRRKFDVYLFYSTRPKDQTKDYFIQIDIYEKETFDYRGSFIKSLNFSFLPVHRIYLEIPISRIVDDLHRCSDIQCNNGKCHKYFNDRLNRTFCQCDEGWSGISCDIRYSSMCSSDSLSFGHLFNNRSICVCPLNKIGPRCFIDDQICQPTTCFNKGKCLSVDEYRTSKKRFVCLCSQGFTGDLCQIDQTKVLLTFHPKVNLPSFIFIHFIEVKLDSSPIRTTTFKSIHFNQNLTTIYWSLPFHLVFIQLSNDTFYLALLQTNYTQSAIIEKTLNTQDQCANSSELFDRTMANSPLIHRIKYYHVLCQRHSPQLKCFYDEQQLCICQQIQQRFVTNCFDFDHQTNVYCSGENGCENGGECFEEQTSCPRISICKCPVCFYGSRCQLTSNGFSLSLDSILGYHIQPNLSFTNQPIAVSISLTLTIIIIILGLIDGISSLMTFKNKITRESGCGIYLFCSSILVLLIMIVFLLKFSILLLSQMGQIQNQLFLTIQCRSIDFLLRSLLTIDQWLTAFVAAERASTIIKGTNFNKHKAKFFAKWIVGGFVLVSIITNIHDPIYRTLFEENNNEDDQKRFWCIVNYPPIVKILSLIINILHFILPFIINIISALIIIFISTKNQIAIEKKKKYQEILKEQIEQHRNLLIGPCVLIILAIPRLIISLISGCIKSDRDSWLSLFGYFISLIPPLLTFILFVLPSTTYRKAFRQVISRYRNIIRHRQ